MSNPDSLVPFKKGFDERRNLEGRPEGAKGYATLYREALIKLAQLNNKEPGEIEAELISNGILQARKGDYRFYKDVLDRLHGTATQKTDITTMGRPIPLFDYVRNNNGDSQSTEPKPEN